MDITPRADTAAVADSNTKSNRSVMSDVSSLIQELEQAISSGTAKKRARALSLVTDLFMHGSGRYSTAQIELFDDVLMTLVASIETKVRVKLSKRLARADDAPLKIVRALAEDEAIDVAGPMLRASSRLSDDDLVQTARTKSQAHLHAITQRAQLSESVTDVLVARGDRAVIHAVAQNAGARFSDQGFGALVRHAHGDDALACHVGARRDIPRHHFVKLLETASAAVRGKLQAANPDMAEAIRDVVAEITTAINEEARNTSHDHSKAKRRVKRLCKTGQFSEADVHSFARANNFEQTAVALAMLGSFPIALVERALLDESPDLVLILTKAARCYWSTTKAILQMTAASRSLSAMDLDHALASFERLQVNTARQALDFYAARSKTALKTKAPSRVRDIVQFADAV
jgi:uncharacterized protein (DUF2336 family)